MTINPAWLGPCSSNAEDGRIEHGGKLKYLRAGSKAAEPERLTIGHRGRSGCRDHSAWPRFSKDAAPDFLMSTTIGAISFARALPFAMASDDLDD